jgi:hypothetical protein
MGQVPERQRRCVGRTMGMGGPRHRGETHGQFGWASGRPELYKVGDGKSASIWSPPSMGALSLFFKSIF